MRISESLKKLANDKLAEVLEAKDCCVNERIPLEGSPFVLSLTGKDILVHGFIDYRGKRYYVGVPEG